MLVTDSLSKRKIFVATPSKKNLELQSAIKQLKKLDLIDSDVDVARLMTEAGFNVTRGALSTYKNGPADPSKNFVNKFNELFAKHGVVLGKEDVPTVKPTDISPEEIPGSVPFLRDMNAFAGTPAELFNDVKEYVTDYIFVPDLKDADYWITVYGDSMYPKYRNGMRIAIKLVDHTNYIAFGQPYFIVTKQNRWLKFIRKGSDKQHWKLVSANKEDYDDFEIPVNDVMSVWKVRAKIDFDDM